MPSLLLPKRFRQQPQFKVAIDRSNPITRGLIFAFNGIGYDAVKDAPFTNMSKGVASGGIGHNVVDSGPLASLSGISTPSLDTLTMFALINHPTVGGSWRGMFGKWDGLNSNRFALGAVAGAFVLTKYPGSDANLGSAAAAGLNSYAATSDVAATLITGYINGAISGTNPSPITYDANTDDWRIGCFRGGATAENFVGVNLLSLVWNRCLSALEIKSLHNNPWQIFLAPRSILAGFTPSTPPTFNPAWAAQSMVTIKAR